MISRPNSTNLTVLKKVFTDLKFSNRTWRRFKNGRRLNLLRLESTNSVIWPGLNSKLVILCLKPKINLTKNQSLLTKLILIGETKKSLLKLKIKDNVVLVGHSQLLDLWNHFWLNNPQKNQLNYLNNNW